MKFHELARPVTANPDTRLLGSYGLLVLTNVALLRKPNPVSPIVYCQASSRPRTSADGPLTWEVMANCASEPSGSVTPLTGWVTVPPTTKLVTSFRNAPADT